MKSALIGSPLIDGGSEEYCPSVDQRCYYRTDGACDIGAHEWGAAESAPTAVQVSVISSLSYSFGWQILVWSALLSMVTFGNLLLKRPHQQVDII